MKTLFILSLVISPLLLSGQQQECKGMLEMAMHQLRQINAPEVGMAHHFAMTIEATARYAPLPVYSVTRSEVKITMTNVFYMYDSDQVSMRIDSSSHFIIIHPKNLIIKSKRNKDLSKIDMRQKMLISIQDSILNSGKMTSCKILADGATIISMQPNEEMIKSLYVQKIDYTLEPKGSSIREVAVYYAEPHKLKKQTVKYLRLETSVPYSINNMKKNLVFNSKGELNERYLKYRLIDQSK